MVDGKSNRVLMQEEIEDTGRRNGKSKSQKREAKSNLKLRAGDIRIESVNNYPFLRVNVDSDFVLEHII